MDNKDEKKVQNLSLSEQIVKYRYFILIVFVVLVILAGVFLPTMLKKVNYDISSYLPEDYKTTQGFRFLSENFNIYGDIELGIHSPDENKVKTAVDKIKSDVEGVTMCAWQGDFDGLEGVVPPEKIDDLKAIFKDGDDYLVLISLKYGSSSKEAVNRYAQITSIIDQEVGENSYVATGMTSQGADLFTNTLGEFWKYALIAIAFVIVILVLTTNSVSEPIVLIMTILLSILINLGTNAIFSSTSIVTFAITAVLQLGLTMDYAIFMLHQYREELKTHIDPKEALTAAIPKSAKAIFASAATTVCGLLALLVMKFRIGPDIGISVAKGIVLSLFTVLLLQPCLMLMFEKVRVKTTHRCLDFHYKTPVKHSIRGKNIIALIFIPVFIIALLVNVDSMPWSLKYTYVHFTKDKVVSDELKNAQRMSLEMNNQVMVALPLYDYVYDKDGNISDVNLYYDEQYEFLEKIDGMIDRGDVKFSLGLFAILDKDTQIEYKGDLYSLDQILKIVLLFPDVVPKEYKSMFNSYISNGYSIYTVAISTQYDIESQEAFDLLDEIDGYATDIFGEYGQIYMTGCLQGAYDFAKVTPTDNMWVSIISAIAIFLILLFTLRSFKFSTVLVALIELGIWINLILQWVFYQGNINFIAYIIISAIQLGSTVDYAILIATRYREYRKRFEPRQAAYMATTKSSMAITTSALILGSACFSVSLVTSNIIVQQLCAVIARGAIIAGALVIFVLPALLVAIDKRRGDEVHFPITPGYIRDYRFRRKNKKKIPKEPEEIPE